MLDMGFIWLASLPLLAFAVGCSCEPAPVGDDEDSEAPPGDSETTADSEPGQDSEPPEPTEGPNLLLNGDFVQGEGAFPGVGLSWETNDAQPHDEDYLDYASPYSGAASQCIATGGSWDVGALRQVSAYGSVLRGVLDGDPAFSVRGDAAEQGWRIVEEVLAAFDDGRVPLQEYPAGSDGPVPGGV